MKKCLLILVISSLFILGCKDEIEDQREIKLRFDWIPTMSFAGDIVGMNNYANLNGIKLILHPAGEGIDPIKMVISGVDDVGVVGLDKLLLANEKGADLVAIAIIDNITPTVFMSKKDKNIITPNDFIGKSIGVQSGGATEFVYRSLLNKLKMDKSNIDEVQIGFDMKPFIEDQYDVRPGFIFDEVVYLDLNNIPYNLIEPKDYGLKYPGRVYFAKRDFINKNPDFIQAFVNTVAAGWEYALNNPDSSINQLQRFEPKINYEREYKGLLKANAYFSGYQNNILMPDVEAINEMIVGLSEIGILKSNPQFEEYFNLVFIKKYHESIDKE